MCWGIDRGGKRKTGARRQGGEKSNGGGEKIGKKGFIEEA